MSTINDEVDILDQKITNTLQKIDDNFSEAHEASMELLSKVQEFGKNMNDVHSGLKIWKRFFHSFNNDTSDLKKNDDDHDGAGSSNNNNKKRSSSSTSMDNESSAKKLKTTPRNENDDLNISTSSNAGLNFSMNMSPPKTTHFLRHRQSSSNSNSSNNNNNNNDSMMSDSSNNNKMQTPLIKHKSSKFFLIHLYNTGQTTNNITDTNMMTDDDDDATPSLSGIKTNTILINNSIIMSTPHHGGSEVSSSNQSETRWSAIRKLQSSIKTPLIKGLNNRRWESSPPAETNRTNNSAIQQLSTSPSSIRKNNNNNNTSLNTSSLNSPKTPGLNSPLKGKYSATPIGSDTSNNNLIGSSPSADAGKKDSRNTNKEEEDEEDDAIDNNNTSSSNNMSNISINLNLSNIVDTSTDDNNNNNNNDSSNVSSLMMTSVRNMNNSMNITASPFNFGTPLSHRIATGSQSSSRRNSISIGNDIISNNNQDQDNNNNTSNNNDDSNLSSFNIDDYGNTSSIQSSPLPDLDIEAMALALEESIDDGTPAPDFDLSLFPSTFQTGKGAISITEVYSSFASISNQKKTTSTDRIAGAMSLEQILKHVPHLKRPMVELLLETLVQHRLLRPFQFRQKIYWQCRE